MASCPQGHRDHQAGDPPQWLHDPSLLALVASFLEAPRSLTATCKQAHAVRRDPLAQALWAARQQGPAALTKSAEARRGRALRLLLGRAAAEAVLGWSPTEWDAARALLEAASESMQEEALELLAFLGEP